MKTLKYDLLNLLDSYYHSEVWDEFGSEEQLWEFIAKQESSNIEYLKSNVVFLLSNSDQYLKEWMKSIQSHGFHIRNFAELRPWLMKLENFLRSTDKIAENYVRDGFAFVPGLFTPDEAQAAKDEIQRLLAARSDHAGVFVGLAAASPHFAALARHPKLLDAIEACIGPDIEFLSDKVVFKSASTDYGSPWHQDWPYWKGAHKLSVWIALDPATPENGCLKLLPGSHRTFFTHDGVAGPGEGFGNRLSEGAVDESMAVTLPCAVGDAILFHDLALHASHPNASGQDRYALISTYRSASGPDLSYDWAVAAEIVREKKTP